MFFAKKSSFFLFFEGQDDPILVVLPQLIQPVKIPLLRVEQMYQHRAVVQYDPAALLLI